MREISVACEANNIDLGQKEERVECLQKCINELINDPNVKFLKRIGIKDNKNSRNGGESFYY